LVRDCVLGRHLERIDRLATLAESGDYKDAMEKIEDLSRELAVLDELPPGSADDHKAPVAVESRTG